MPERAHNTMLPAPACNVSLPAQAAKRALQEMEQCELRIKGPPEPTWLATTPRAALLLQEALSVVELVHGLAEALHVAPVTLAELTHACRLPLRSPVLPALYLALLRYCLLEVMQTEKPRALPSNHPPS